MNDYIEFLRQKQKVKSFAGIEVSIGELNPMLFDWQKETVKWALSKGRAGLFEDCGLGKTAQQLEWANQVYKHTDKNVLILAPLAVSMQTVKEGATFGIEVNICRSQADIKPGINITNYEMLDKFNPDRFGGVVLDESSILKSYMGKTKQQIIDAFRNTPFKLTCTATPAPNNHLELLNQAEFLGVMRANEALSIWFINDTTQAGNYRLKRHAVRLFWEWVSTWAICMSKPSDIGFSDDGYELPALNETDVILPVDTVQINEGSFLREIGTSATEFHKEKRFTADARARKCAEIVNDIDEQAVVWCDTNYEADLLKKYIPHAVEVRGSDKSAVKECAAVDFIEGKTRVLISKPSMFGYGLNFQNCRYCIFCGRDYSYENYYQAVRRFWRYGQTKPVNVISVLGSTENNILEVINQKKALQDEMKTNMYSGIKQIQQNSIKGKEFRLNLETPDVSVPEWLKGA